MIDLYYCGTPNGLKMTVFFAEAGLPHRIIPVDIGKGDQFKPEFVAISPNNKIPAMVDHAPVDGGEPIALFESGAMLLYLADKIGRFLPRDLRGRNEVIKWLFWQVGGLGADGRTDRPFQCLCAGENALCDRSLFARDAIASTGPEYPPRRSQFHRQRLFDCRYGLLSLDRPHKGHGQSLDDFPNLKRWFETIARRPAVIRAYEGTTETYSSSAGNISEAERRILFGTPKAKTGS